MLIAGLTGSIGMGKSATAEMFQGAGIPVFDADGTVHALQAPGGPSLNAIDAAFPGSVVGGHLDRQKLGALVFADPAKLKTLEAIMHPLVSGMRAIFIRNNQHRGSSLVVLDEPLLFEMKVDHLCDAVIVVSAPAAVQRQRVMDRPGMTAEKFSDIMRSQMSDADKRARATYIVETDKGFDHARARVCDIIKDLEKTA